MRPLQVFESAIAKQLGMPGGKDLDEVAVLHKVKALRKDGHLANLKILHHLRLQYNRTRDKLPAKLQVYPFLPGVSRNHSNCLRTDSGIFSPRAL